MGSFLGTAWYRHFPSDFLDGVKALTPEDRGNYITVIDLIYQFGGRISDNAQWIAGQCNTTTRAWNRSRQRLLATGKLIATEGWLTNPRAIREIAASTDMRERMAAIGSVGGVRSSISRKSQKNRQNAKQEHNDYNDIAQNDAHNNDTLHEHREKLPEKLVVPSEESVENQDSNLTRVFNASDKSLSLEEGVCIPEGACSLAREPKEPTPSPESAPPTERKLPAAAARFGPRRYDDVRIELDNGEPSVNGFLLEYTFEKAMEDAGIDPAKSTATYKPVVQWLADGYNTKQIRAAISRVMARGTGVRPMSLAYFDKAVRDQRPEETPMRRVGDPRPHELHDLRRTV